MTAAATPRSNGVAERLNGVLLATVRILLVDSGLSEKYWPFALRFAVDDKNRLIHRRLVKRDVLMTPEAFMGYKGSTQKLKFGQRIVVYNTLANGVKYNTKTDDACYLCIDPQSLGCSHVLKLCTQKVISTRPLKRSLRCHYCLLLHIRVTASPLTLLEKPMRATE